MMRRLLSVFPVAKNNMQIRKFSSEPQVVDVDTWLKVYREMRHEASVVAEGAVSSVKSDVSSVKADVSALRSEVRADVSALKGDIAAVKADVSALKADVSGLKNEMQGLRVEMHKQISDIHKQMGNNTRTLLAGMFGSVTVGLGVSQYLESRKNKAANESLAHPATTGSAITPR